MDMCEKCNGTGLLPHIKLDGTVSKHARIFCPECHDEYANPYPYALKPSDFDYAMSFSVYRSLCQEHGWPDPGSDEPDELPKPQEQVVVHRHSSLSKQDWDLLQQTARRAEYLERKLNELMAKRKTQDYEPF